MKGNIAIELAITIIVIIFFIIVGIIFLKPFLAAI